MFPPPREVLRAKSGTLSDTPLPLLLTALEAEARSVTLVLTLRNLEKRVFIDEGVPVGVESNLTHEGFGRQLVARGRLTDEQHHSLLSDAIAAGVPLPTLLVERKVLAPSELFKQLQANLGLSLLDAFRWGEASWSLEPFEDVQTPIRMNVAQLVFTGAAQLPAELLGRHFSLADSQQLGLVPGRAPGDDLKLSAKDTRLVSWLKRRASVAELCGLPGLTRDEVLRRLFALAVLGFIDTAQALDARGVAGPASALEAPEPAPSPPRVAPPPGVPFFDEDEATMNLLAAECLAFHSRDAFEQLGVTVDTQGTALQTAFLSRCEKLSPSRFRSAEAKKRAELMLCVYARAFGALSDPDQWQLHRQRRATREAAKRGQGPNVAKAAAQMKIRTELLDADAQLAEGRKRLEAGNVKSALEHFQYAVDIEPRARCLAWLAFGRYRDNPERQAESSLTLLAEACAKEPRCEEAWAFRADIAMSLGRFAEAEEAYQQAHRLHPANKRYAETAQKAGALARRR